MPWRLNPYCGWIYLPKIFLPFILSFPCQNLSHGFVLPPRVSPTHHPLQSGPDQSSHPCDHCPAVSAQSHAQGNWDDLFALLQKWHAKKKNKKKKTKEQKWHASSHFYFFLNIVYFVCWADLFPFWLIKSYTSCKDIAQFSSVQLLSRGWLFATPWTVVCQASLSITNSQSLLKLMSMESVMPPNHLILCYPLLLLPSIFPCSRVFYNESALHIRWPKFGAPALVSVLPMCIQDWFPLGLTGLISLQSKGLLREFSNQHHSSKVSIL